MPGGMFAADENARMGYIDPRQGTETCGFAEQMATDEILMLTTGDPYWAENCEDVAFNSFPAAFSEDYKALRYLHECPHCHSKNVDYMTRIIGYLKRVSNFSEARQQEAGRRHYAVMGN